jgi:hypothetical protein
VAKQDTSFNDFINGLSRAPEDLIIKISQQLKDAKLYKGEITGKFDINLYNALITASQGYKSENLFATKFDKPVVTPINYLEQIGREGLQTGTGETGAGETTSTKQTYITSPSQTAKLLDAVAVDLLERKLTKAEKAKYLKLINAEQKRQPSVQTSGKGFNTTQGGIDEGQFITEKLESTAEAKTVRATDAYSIMMQEFGGLR